jgi:hypothetical protein
MFPAETWLRNRVAGMSEEDRCQQVTAIAHRLESEMYEAARRGHVDAHWSWGHIKNTLLDLGLWPKRRR